MAQGWLPSKVCQTRMSTSQAATLCDTFSWECAGLVQSVFSFLCFKIATSTSFPSSVWLLITVTVNAIFNRRWMFTTVENKKKVNLSMCLVGKKTKLIFSSPVGHRACPLPGPRCKASTARASNRSEGVKARNMHEMNENSSLYSKTEAKTTLRWDDNDQ